MAAAKVVSLAELRWPPAAPNAQKALVEGHPSGGESSIACDFPIAAYDLDSTFRPLPDEYKMERFFVFAPKLRDEQPYFDKRTGESLLPPPELLGAINREDVTGCRYPTHISETVNECIPVPPEIIGEFHRDRDRIKQLLLRLDIKRTEMKKSHVIVLKRWGHRRQIESGLEAHTLPSNVCKILWIDHGYLRGSI
jgi:hypothetical protein